MKKLLLVACVLLLASSVVLAGGIVTNTNQSAEYARMLNRNASTDVDAVYYNPAGLNMLQDGIHLYLSNQSIFQTREVKNSYTALNENKFKADVNAPLFPDVFAAYKSGKLAVSAGVTPIGGGGSANYKDGAPSFEVPFAAMVPTLTSMQVPGINGYQLDASFEGSSVYLGAQAAVSYKVNDMLSVGLGGRYVMANNTYKGHLKDIMLNTDAGTMPPGDYLRIVAQQLRQAGQTDLANQLEGYASQFDMSTADRIVDVKQTGNTFNGIISANLSPTRDINIGLRYETMGAMDVKNDTKESGGLKQFKADSSINKDIPAMFAGGISYRVLPQLKAMVDFNYYFNSGAGWSIENGNTTAEDDYEAGIGLEYSLNPKLLISAGYLYSKSGATKYYQEDISYSLSSNSVAVGAKYQVMPNLGVSLGVLNTFYMENSESIPAAEYVRSFGLGPATSVTQTYNKTSLDIAIGVSYSM